MAAVLADPMTTVLVLPKPSLRVDAKPPVPAPNPCVPVPKLTKSSLRFDAKLFVPASKPCVPVPKPSTSGRVESESRVAAVLADPATTVPVIKSSLRFDAELYVSPPEPSESSKASCGAPCFVPAPKPYVPASQGPASEPAPDAVVFVTAHTELCAQGRGAC
jgi:hypothetical protein